MQKPSTALQRLKQNLSDTPAWALIRINEARVNKLQALNLSRKYQDSHKALTKLPHEIFDLPWLTELNLSVNEFSTLPESITQLQNLTELDLSGNQFSTLPEAVTQLQNLTRLYLSSNQFSTLPEAITQLQNLSELYLLINQLSTLPEAITRLQNLNELYLGGNQLSTLPEAITQLQNLTTLYLDSNRFSTLPEAITQLQNLTELDLSSNQLSSLPEAITRLQNLTKLNLGGNQLSTLPEAITQLQNLTTLHLNSNQLSSLPEPITQLQNLTTLYLGGNPLTIPPIEVSKEGIDAIRQYFRQLEEEGIDHLYEAKVLVLGEGGAGKTTFARKLMDFNYVLQDEQSTQGVDVLKWTFPIGDNKQFTTNIWDFGGQEIYHATHQFFLTRRSLYILVADTRKEDTDFYYWLNVAELLSDGSPLLIVKNEKQDRHREINANALKAQFGSLKDVLSTNLATNRGLKELKQEIQHRIQKLPHIGTPLPRTWVRVREGLEKDPRNHISLEEYFSICKVNGFVERNDALQLSGYLNDIGVFLHFQDEPLLERIVILKPKWGTDAVYKVLDNKNVIKNLGRFTRGDLEAIWSAPEYEAMRDELLLLMMKFKLCYEIPTQKGTFIAPQLLTENQPGYEWEAQDNLLLRYSYEFMPKGIITQFIVLMHPYILDQRIVWKSGVVIEKDETLAEVIEYYGKREIHVRVAGPQARDLMTTIRDKMLEIHETYKRLKYDELVRCICSSCKDSPEPHFYAVAKLREFRANNQLEIQCQKKPYEMVNVMKLLGDTIDLSQLSEKAGGDVYNIGHYHKYEQGDNKMAENKIHIEGSTIHGSVIAAESIKDSFNNIQKADIKDDLKEQLTLLTQAVETMIKGMPKEQNEQAEEVADYMKRLSEEATKPKPKPQWYSVSIDGLIAAAQNIGKVGDEVIALATKVRKILTGGLL